jgi:hypothetical protein
MAPAAAAAGQARLVNETINPLFFIIQNGFPMPVFISKNRRMLPIIGKKDGGLLLALLINVRRPSKPDIFRPAVRKFYCFHPIDTGTSGFCLKI